MPLAAAIVWLSNATPVPWQPVFSTSVRWRDSNVSTSPDHQRLVTANWPEGLTVWDMNRGTPVSRLADGLQGAWETWVSADGRLVSAHDGDGFSQWDLESGALRCGHGSIGGKRVGHGRFGVASAAMSADGRQLLVVGVDAIIRLWDVSDGGLTLVASHAETSQNVAWGAAAHVSPDGRRFAVAWNGGVLVGDLPSLGVRWYGKTLAKRQPVVAFTASRPGHVMAAGVFDAQGASRTGWWDADTGRLVESIGVDHEVDAAALTADGSRAVFAGGGQLSVWDLRLGRRVARRSSRAWTPYPYSGTTREQRPLCWVGHDRIATAGDWPDEVVVLNSGDGSQVSRLPVSGVIQAHGPVSVVAAGAFLVTQDWLGNVETWHQAGDETPLGMIASGRWWGVLGACVILAWSLRRDAQKGARSPAADGGVGLLLVLCGALAFATLLGWYAAGGTRGVTLRLFRWDHVGIWLGFASLVCGLGLATGSRGWLVVARSFTFIVVPVCAIGALWLLSGDRGTWRILDRAWSIPAPIGAGFWVAAASLSAWACASLHQRGGEDAGGESPGV